MVKIFQKIFSHVYFYWQFMTLIFKVYFANTYICVLFSVLFKFLTNIKCLFSWETSVQSVKILIIPHVLQLQIFIRLIPKTFLDLPWNTLNSILVTHNSTEIDKYFPNTMLLLLIWFQVTFLSGVTLDKTFILSEPVSPSSDEEYNT